MLKVSLAGVRAHRLRLMLTGLAIMLGVGFIAGTFVLTDTMQAGIDKKFAGSASKVDVAVLPKKGKVDVLPEEGPGGDRVPADLLTKIRALPGVTAVHGLVRGEAPLIGKDGKVYGDSPTRGLSVTDGPLQRYDIVAGKAPVAPDEAVLDERTAKRNGFKVGAVIRVLDAKGAEHRFTLTGLADFGVDSEVGFYGGVGFTPATAVRMTGERDPVEIDVLGGDQAALRDAVAAVAGARYDVLTSRALGDRLADAAGADTKIIRTGLLIFGVVSMLVSALVIYNTFAILIAQRMREMALLRCVGATRRQVFGGVLLESAVVGLAGSLAGLALGVVLAAGLLALVGGMNAEIPTDRLTLTPTAVAVGLTVGIVVTVLSALLPARAATRIAPVAALRSELEPGGGRFRLGWPRRILTVLFGVLGVGLALLGSLSMDKGETAMFVVAAGGALLFLAVIALMPALVRPLGGAAGALPARLTGVPGRLAVANARRTPRRTATTTIALTIGVGLMSLFAVVAASGQATVVANLEEQFPVDFQLHTQFSSAQTDPELPPALAAGLRARSELTGVVEMRRQEARVGGDEVEVGTATPAAFGRLLKPPVRSGSLADLKTGTVAVNETIAKHQGLAVGDTLRIGTGRGQVPLKVVAVFGGETSLSSYVVPESDFTRYFGAKGPWTIYVNVRPGTDPERALRAVEQVAQPYPTVKATSATAVKEQFTSAFDTMLMIFGGLLGLAVIIALFGIANTLSLSVVERTRESALLRALGITRGQLRLMLSVEAVIMAIIGALTGVVLGVAFGWAATESMADSSVFALPYGQIVGLMALAGLAGLLAAVLPARRAARTSVVESLSHG
ncbi:putative ABC transport system permease protein [Thermomonospora echinospora]|uniref:Putative ABC transport system permease protein n=1 Tax=Thermomonospora echinospora TaxID=1992 RepID=A0A1H5YXK2_9ACTN|nr:FtsX-like permease family protein [Thermomonospora echinospora]SEG28177.1 putative ABC transport system permease protein [Thermomonospora echinospora]